MRPHWREGGACAWAEVSTPQWRRAWLSLLRLTLDPAPCTGPQATHLRLAVNAGTGAKGPKTPGTVEFSSGTICFNCCKPNLRYKFLPQCAP